MPIEIKELHIRVAVNTPQGGQTTGGQAATGGSPDTGGDGANGKEAIVADCVEQVLEILKNKMDR
jgi:hypothetical protein